MYNEDYENDTDSIEDRLERIENSIGEVSSNVRELRSTVSTIIFVFWCIVIGALWGDKIWGFIKGVFWAIIGIGVYLFQLATRNSATPQPETRSQTDYASDFGAYMASKSPALAIGLVIVMVVFLVWLFWFLSKAQKPKNVL